MKRIRFSLRGLILAVTAIGLFLGYSQYRRQEILKAYKELHDYGYSSFAGVPNAWHDHLWQRQPNLNGHFYVANRKILLLDLKNEGEDGKTIVNLKTLGFTPDEIREFEANEKASWERDLALRLRKWDEKENAKTTN